MKEVNGQLRMTIAELIAELQQLPQVMEVTGMHHLIYWVQHEEVEAKLKEKA